MRKGFKLLPIILIVLMLTTTVFAEPIKVLVENKELELQVAPVAQDGRTLVPLRAIFEALGAKVEWDQPTKTITGIQGNKIIILQLDNKIASIDGVEIELDVPATAINGTTLVPVRFIAESLGAEVGWDGPTKTVLVNSTIEGLLGYEEVKEEVKQEVNQNHINNSLIVSPGEDTRVTIEGTPGVRYAISVYYNSGKSTAKGLEPKTADGNGNVSWTWKVGNKTKPGQYKIVITGDKTIELILTVK